MQVMKTVKVKVYKPTNVKEEFMQLIHENALLLNRYAGLIQKHGAVSKTRLHKLSYRKLRKISGLPSAIVQTARDKAVEAYKSYYARKKCGLKAKPPVFSKTVPVRLDKRTLRIIKTDNKIRYFASVTTNGKRVNVPLLGQRYQYKYLAKLMLGELQMGAAELVKRGSDFYLYLTLKKEVALAETDECRTPIGVDLGLVNLSTSVILRDNKVSDISFHRGRKAIKVRNQFAAFRTSLGKAKKLWRIRLARGKENQWMRDLNHKISSAIVKKALAVNKPVIVMEQLKHIRRRIKYSRKINRLLHNWSFAQLQSFIEYKAAWKGIPVVYVRPDYTSQCCSKCGHTEKANRNRRNFKCRQCGYELNADLNAAINIGKRYKNFVSGYMSGVTGDVATPLTLQATAYQGNPHLQV